MNTQNARQPKRARAVVFVPVDQLNASIGPLARLQPADTTIVVVETPQKAARRPYHKQKLALVLTSLRHFALEQAERGCEVVHLVDDDGYGAALRRFAKKRPGPIACMTPAERELRVELQPLVDDGLMHMVPHEGWLTTRAEFDEAQTPAGKHRMDAFYRVVRKRTGLLMDARNKPIGGKLSHDADNRRRWTGTPRAPKPLRFAVDAITEEVGAIVEDRYAGHPGVLDLSSIAATARDVAALWAHAKATCLEHFGPFEDALSTSSRTLFHTLVSPYLNTHRLLPKTAIDDVAALDIPLSSKEGFIRQVIGWREFVHHVHDATDGFRTLEPSGAPNALAQTTPLPAAYWPRGPWNASGARSGLRCLDHVVAGLWESGYSHHISRLMVLSNIAALLDVNPRELTDWFWVAYVDAYDWVVEPNVLAMGTYAAGDVMTTKPYVAGAGYIDRMSDFCGPCAFSPKATAPNRCPLTPMYWAFLNRHADALADNDRIKLPLRSAQKRSAAQKAEDDRLYQIVRRTLRAGEPVTPELLR